VGMGKMRIYLMMFMVAPPLVGLLIAWGVSHLDKSNFDARIKAARASDMQWVYGAAFVFARTCQFVNTYPMIAKAGVMSGKAGNLRANMYIYKVLDATSDKSRPVVLQEEGVIGEYNRANRSMHHFVENMAAMVISMYLVGVIFPVPCFVISTVYAVGRVWHQVGYSTGGYGSHGSGFGLVMISGAVMEGFLLLVCCKSA